MSARVSVRLPSGNLLARLSVTSPASVAELKLCIEQLQKLPPGRVLRHLMLGSTPLHDEELVDLGEGAEILAICADVLEGDFETYVPGCPSCDLGSEMQSARFFADGTCWVLSEVHGESREFHYQLGEWKEGERQLELRSLHGEETYAASLVSGPNPIYRRLQIPELRVDVEDIRYLRQKGRTALQQKLELLFHNQHLLHVPCELRCIEAVNPSRIPHEEMEIWRCWANARAQVEEHRREEEWLERAEPYEDLGRRRCRDRRSKESLRRKRHFPRWQRPAKM